MSVGDDIPYFVGTPHGDLAEVPIQWLLDDAPFYRHVYGSTNGIAEPDGVIRLWTQEFQGLYRENGCFVLTMLAIQAPPSEPGGNRRPEGVHPTMQRAVRRVCDDG
jgi:hypothetical protein